MLDDDDRGRDLKYLRGGLLTPFGITRLMGGRLPLLVHFHFWKGITSQHRRKKGRNSNILKENAQFF